MRVVTWNIERGERIDAALIELAQTEALQNADVLMLQEMDEAGTAAIADALGGTYAYANSSTDVRSGRDFGNAIVSRWPIAKGREVPLPHRAAMYGRERSATHAMISFEDIEVSTYSVHTEVPSLRLARRLEQFDAIASDVLKVDSSHVVIGGDFNTITNRGLTALERSLARAALLRVSQLDDPSYRRVGKTMTLDHVFASGFATKDAGVTPSTSASDHLPLWVLLERIEPENS